MTIELSDEKVLLMAEAISKLREAERLCARKNQPAPAFSQDEYQANLDLSRYKLLQNKLLALYEAHNNRVRTLAAELLDDYRNFLRAVADGKDVA